MRGNTTAVRADIASYVAVGDSFTEGLGDFTPEGRPVGWADRLADCLAERRTDRGFHYANLAVRGQVIGRIIDGQVSRARELRPDLITFCAGGNDLIRPGSDPDRVADQYERAVALLAPAAGTLLLFTGFDTRGVPLLRRLRGKIATYTAHVRAIADRYGCPVVDLWSLPGMRERRAWSEDRLHLSPYGHIQVAREAAYLLGVGGPVSVAGWSVPGRPRQTTRRDDLHWAREHFVPWVGRQLLGRSAADGAGPKRPDLLPLAPAGRGF